MNGMILISTFSKTIINHATMIIHQHCYTRECMKEMISVVENPEPILATSRCPPSLKKTVAIIVYQSSLSSSRHHDHHDHQDHHDCHDGHDHHHHIIIVILTASRCPPWLKKTVLSAFHSHHHRRRGFRDWEWEHNTLKYLRPGGGLSRTVPWCPPGGRFWHSDHQ